ncbi:MAG: DUF2177 family protein [Chromatiaceae bacterium]|nr:MAG: DUF2177 family protein [Chromatiaceae bacterium]
MTLRFYLKLYLLTVPLFFAIDMLWLGVLASGFYRQRLGHLLADQVNWAAALTFYLVYIAGIMIFAVVPGLRSGALGPTALRAAGFGFFTYITYELTNMATLPDWPLQVVLVDTLWGMLLCTLVAVGSFAIGRRLLVRAGAV